MQFKRHAIDQPLSAGDSPCTMRPPRAPTRTYSGKIADPSQWDRLDPRPRDIVVTTPTKSGTTWTQGILALLISGDPMVNANVTKVAPWVDIDTPEQAALMDGLNAQTGRRHMKTHTPLDGIPVWPDMRYITVYRHPIDVHFSFRRHVENMRDEVLQELYPPDLSEGFRLFVEGDHRDGASLLSIIDHYRSALEPMNNLLRLHYADMTRDLHGAIQQIAQHVGIQHPAELERQLVDAASFANMKANADRFALAAGEEFWTKDTKFFDSGTSNKWAGKLTADDLVAYDARMDALLSPEDRRWLEWGSVQPSH